MIRPAIPSSPFVPFPSVSAVTPRICRPWSALAEVVGTKIGPGALLPVCRLPIHTLELADLPAARAIVVK